MKKVFKYGTGDEIPEGAIYLTTITQYIVNSSAPLLTTVARMVWHYFLVEA